MITVKFSNGMFRAVIDGTLYKSDDKFDLVDILFDLGFDNDDIIWPSENDDNNNNSAQLNVSIQENCDIINSSNPVREVIMNDVTQKQANISYFNNKFVITDISSNTTILSDSRYPNAKARAKKLGYYATPDDSVLNGTFTDEQAAPKRLTKVNNDNIVIHDKAVIRTNDVSVSIAKSEFSVKERFEFIEEFTRLCARGVIPSLILTGSGGIGKTKNVIKTLTSLHLTEDGIGEVDGDYIFVKGYSTARNLYTTLYNNNGKIIIFDDCDSAFKDPISSNILKGALDSNGKRIITWGAESRDESIPARFEFFGKVIFISNISLSKFPQALLSRSMLVDLTLDNLEMIERIEQVFNEETEYDTQDKIGALDFIKRNAAKFKDLNVRSAFNALKMKVAIGDNWEKMALYSATVN